LISRTGKQIYWLCSMAHYTSGIVAWAERGTTPFRSVTDLPPWSEASISDLINKRMKASAFQVSYEELLVDTLEGVDTDQQVLSTARDYNRLVWDYADGSPRSALDVWRKSLVPEDDTTLSVRLFQAPSASDLDHLTDVARFCLAGIAWHGRISEDDLSESLRLPLKAVHDEVQKLCESETLIKHEGLLAVSVPSWPVVTRYLKRKHLVSG